ncbi:MAG: molybdopterin synthase catalytic subunit MoaE [Porticoccaceae bacterium]|nr:molybdopterin synthase catalytic subunit MoaE [Porticoccaceae bacterium]
MRNRLVVQLVDFDLAAEYRRLCELDGAVGAVVTFCGLVRDCEQQAPIDSLTLQHYPGMTEASLGDIVASADRRWPLHGITIIHRVGELLPRDQIVFVGVASGHRAAAFQAADYLMDYLKTRAMFWKNVAHGGERQWVDCKDSDRQAAHRWSQDPKRQ